MTAVEYHLQSESEIIWLDDPEKYRYVRERTELCRSRTGFDQAEFERSGESKLIGYAELKAATRDVGRVFFRRIWFVKTKEDPWFFGVPLGAAEPGSICAGISSTRARMVSNNPELSATE